MWTLGALLLSAVGIALVEIPRLKKNNMNKDLIVFICLLLVGTILGAIKIIHHSLPNPLDLITWVFQPASKLLQHLLQ